MIGLIKFRPGYSDFVEQLKLDLLNLDQTHQD